jgi:hypothetical protein
VQPAITPEPAVETGTDAAVETPAATQQAVPDYASQFLDKMADIQDRYANLTTDQKDRTRERALEMVQGLVVSQMLTGLATQQTATASTQTKSSDAVSGTMSLANRWYMEA